MSCQEKYLKYKIKYLKKSIPLNKHTQHGTGHNNDSTCPICMVSLIENFPEVLIECGINPLNVATFSETTCCHNIFHTECLEEWKRRGHNDCPICRTSPIHCLNEYNIEGITFHTLPKSDVYTKIDEYIRRLQIEQEEMRRREHEILQREQMEQIGQINRDRIRRRVEETSMPENLAEYFEGAIDTDTINSYQMIRRIGKIMGYLRLHARDLSFLKNKIDALSPEEKSRVDAIRDGREPYDSDYDRWRNMNG
jgi:hypothetical protein